MKILKYILGIVTILVLGFFLWGVIKSEVAYEYEIIEDKPIAESGAVSQDKAKITEIRL